MLLKAKANVNLQDNYDITPLYVAAMEGDGGLVQTLLDAGAKPKLGDESFVLPAMWAAEKLDPESFKLLLGEAKSFVGWYGDQWGRAAIHWATAAGRLDNVKACIEATPEKSKTKMVNIEDGGFRTPLEYAEEYKYEDISQFLTENGGMPGNKCRGNAIRCIICILCCGLG